MILALFVLIVTLLLVVGIHEAGHAVAARLFQVRIQKIAIGFGKPLFKWTDRTGREWIWARWPLGGYVHLLNTRIAPVDPINFHHCFDKKPVWMRCVILVSGALTNILTAWLALTLVFMLGFHQQNPIIQEIIPQSTAALAGFKANDRIVTMDGQNIGSWQEVGMSLIMGLGKSNIVTVINQGVVREITLNLSQLNYKKTDRNLLTVLGIKPALTKLSSVHVKGLGFWQAANQALTKIGHLFRFFLIMLKQIITAAVPFSVLLGPLGLLSASVGSFLQGITVFLNFIASLSLAVALVNLFPIPGLDGGLLVYALIEKIRGKPISIAVEVLLHRCVSIVFALLLFQLMMNDIQRYLH